LSLVNVGTLLAFIVVSVGVIYLRHKRPDIERPFRSPFVPAFPIIGILIDLVLIVFGLSPQTLIWFLCSLAVGLAIFFAYGYRKSNPALIGATAEDV
jgi:basic amino acid/polyamine antiporter, APA family